MKRFLAVLAFFFPVAAHAGAWTLNEDSTQIIAGTTWSTAGTSFDDKGAASQPAIYEKWLSSADAEYGWNDYLTLIVAPEFAHARVGLPSGVVSTANDFAIAGGARVRLDDLFGVLSAQLTAKSAGAFDMSVSANGAAGRQLELRLLYGTNFTVLGYDGYFDAEAAERLIAGLRPDELPIDLTLGVQVTPHTTVMAQSFNIIAAGNAKPPYEYYRQHKLELSAVTRLTDQFSLQSGAFISPAGQNTLVEQGFSVALWAQF